MKHAVLTICTVTLFAACATTDATESTDPTSVTADREPAPDRGADVRAGDVRVDAIQIQTLADALVRLPGVMVDERGAATRVRVRGRAPLYVIDNLPIGFSYAEANNLVIPNDIARVDVLTGIEATTRFGSRGGNGAILITTRRG